MFTSYREMVSSTLPVPVDYNTVREEDVRTTSAAGKLGYQSVIVLKMLLIAL